MNKIEPTAEQKVDFEVLHETLVYLVYLVYLFFYRHRTMFILNTPSHYLQTNK